MRLPPDALLGEVDGGFRLVMESFQWERLAMALAAVSAAARNLAVARAMVYQSDHVSRAEMHAQIRELVAVRALAYDALAKYVRGEDALREVSAAKWRGCDLNVRSADLRLRLATAAGGDATGAERALRDARLGPIGGGAREVMAELVARTLGL
ncbi:MAG: hypothetical protein LC640_06505 [Frankia sp.]|nr:hypothetical protein [Frankia sp.]